MKAVFLGVGEACDERLPNTSVWIRMEVDGLPRSVLLDCGFTVPPLYWAQTGDPEDLDALWISHFHGDHFFGVPALLLRFWETKRRKPLAVVGQPGVRELVEKCVRLAYPNIYDTLTYPVEFFTAEVDRPMKIAGLAWRFAENVHGQRDLAVRIEDGQHSVFYSGDGLFSPETIELARGCDVAIHEAFRLDSPVAGHGSVLQCLDFAAKAGVGVLALVHVQRDERREKYDDILRVMESVTAFHVLLPEPGDELEL